MPAKRIFLSGIDYFQLLIDHHSKKKGGKGHEARLAVFLHGQIDEHRIHTLLRTNETCIELAKVRLSKTFGLGYPSLYYCKNNPGIPAITHHIQEDEIPEHCLNISVDPYKNPPVHLQIIYFSNGNSCLLFTFHHIFFDFAGVQSFINSLTGKKDIPLLPFKNFKRPFPNRFKAFFRAVFFTFREANSKMSVLENPLPGTKPLLTTFREISFTAEETQTINKNIAKTGLQINQSIYFLAAVCKSLHDNIFIKQEHHNFLWVPVPVNFRKKGKADAVMFNGLSFLFYKIKREQLNEFSTIISSLREQMKVQMQNKMPEAFIDFADAYWYMPMPFYYPMLKLPSLGKLSSFSFSVLGKTFKDLDEFMGLPIMDIKNYPSNSTAPAVTFLFYEFRGELRIMSSWVKGQYDIDVQEAVINQLRRILLHPIEE